MKRICVYCGAKAGNAAEYAAAADALGDALLLRGIGLVFGGGSIGMMGRIADRVVAGNGEVIGVIPEALRTREVVHQGVTEMRVVADMHQRKALLADLADGFIALPGGFGTLEELFEALAWLQLKFHHKPCGLLNVHNYYDLLLQFLDHAVTVGFLRPKHRQLLCVDDNPARLVDELLDRVRA